MASYMDGLGTFITTSIPTGPGSSAERKVVDAIRPVVSARQGIGYWHFPLVDRYNKIREPDILILDKGWGIVLIEVKGIKIDDLKGISGYKWFLKKPYYKEKDYISPYKQGRDYADIIRCRLERSGIEDLKRMPIRALVALPYITRTEWEESGYGGLIMDTPILFKDELGLKTLQRAIEITPTMGIPIPMSEKSFQNLLMAFGMQRPKVENSQKNLSAKVAGRKSEIIKRIRDHIHKYDVQQEKIAKSIPPGPQRIRGIAGSGKTILLAQKAANMHLLYPDWKIALVFFSRSLYEQIEREVEHWLDIGSNGKISLKDEKVREKLLILHAWGGEDEGFYSYLAKSINAQVLAVKNIQSSREKISPSQGVIYCANALLRYASETGKSLECFDAVLIDEGQDLVSDSEKLSFKDKQAYYWMAYESLKPVQQAEALFDEVKKPVMKRLIWAYDEAQSLDSLVIPKADALFGKDGPVDVSGSYPGGFYRSEIMRRCYRTPGQVLMAAHALGMGWLLPECPVGWISRKENWERIGYRVEGGTLHIGQTITISRPLENSPHPLSNSQENLITFQKYDNIFEEADGISRAIKHDIEKEGVEPHDIMVICLGKYSNPSIDRMYSALRKYGVDTLISGNKLKNTRRAVWEVDSHNVDRDKFREKDCVTITGIHRAKGNEASIIYVVGLEEVGKAAYDVSLRNQLFVAISRSRGWVNLSGSNIPSHFAAEVEAVLASPQGITLTVKRQQRITRVLDDE